MFKSLYRVVLFTIIFLTLIGCEKDDNISLSVTPQSLEFGYLSEEKEFSVSSSASWIISVPADVSNWCSVTPLNGEGKAVVKVSLKTNLFPVERKAVLVLNSEGKKTEFTLKQGASLGRGEYVDGEVRRYVVSSKSKPINLVFLGDGFIKEDLKDGGAFDAAVAEGFNALFSVEPYKTYKEYFNVYKIGVVSSERGATYSDKKRVKNTAFGTSYNGGSAMNTNSDKVFSYAQNIPGIVLEKTWVILIVNDTRYGGTAILYSDGKAVAMCPMNRSSMLPGGYGPIMIHEAGGHAFGQLADEYVSSSNVSASMPESEKKELNQWFGFGFYSNIDLTNNPLLVKWAEFIGKQGYNVNVFEGGYTYKYGVWRPEQYSCMDDNRAYFNAPSRAAIVKRILTLAGEEFTIDKFVAKDVVKTPYYVFTQTRGLSDEPIDSKLPRLAPPKLIVVE